MATRQRRGDGTKNFMQAVFIKSLKLVGLLLNLSQLFQDIFLNDLTNAI